MHNEWTGYLKSQIKIRKISILPLLIDFFRRQTRTTMMQILGFSNEIRIVWLKTYIRIQYVVTGLIILFTIKKVTDNGITNKETTTHEKKEPPNFMINNGMIIEQMLLCYY